MRASVLRELELTRRGQQPPGQAVCGPWPACAPRTVGLRPMQAALRAPSGPASAQRTREGLGDHVATNPRPPADDCGNRRPPAAAPVRRSDARSSSPRPLHVGVRSTPRGRRSRRRFESAREGIAPAHGAVGRTSSSYGERALPAGLRWSHSTHRAPDASATRLAGSEAAARRHPRPPSPSFVVYPRATAEPSCLDPHGSSGQLRSWKGLARRGSSPRPARLRGALGEAWPPSAHCHRTPSRVRGALVQRGSGCK